MRVCALSRPRPTTALARFVGEDKLTALCDQLTELVASAGPPDEADEDAEPAPLEVVWLPKRGEAAA